MKRVSVILLLVALLGLSPLLASQQGVVSGARVEMASSEPAVQGGAGQITFTAGDSEVLFNVFSITGQLVRSVRVSAHSRLTVEMPKGFYIVRCGSRWSRKVVVK